MHKDRTFLAVCAGLLVVILFAIYRPKPAAVTVLPLYYNPIAETSPVSERFWVLKAQAPTHFDLVAMGDSRVYRGISPEAMKVVLKDRTILNFGFSSGGLNPEMYAAAEGRLDPASRHKAILFGVSPQTLCPRTESNDHFMQEMNRPPDYVFLHLYWLPLVSGLEPLNLSAWGQPPASDTQEGYYLEFHDDGWVASWTVPEVPDSQIESYREIFSTTQVSPRLVQALLDQTRQWVSQGIRVYAYRPPTSQAMADLENQQSGFNEAQFAAQFKAAGGTWFSIPLAPYHSYDGSHLVKASAVKLSLDIAGLIKQSEGH
jgi:hypothetical protein